MYFKREKWTYPALRAWHKIHQYPDQHIDALVINARRVKAPKWAIYQEDNGKWKQLNKDVDADIEFTFLINHPQILQEARESK